ncbi:MAG: phosphoglucosamine mutase [Planctomycetota bacterium]
MSGAAEQTEAPLMLSVSGMRGIVGASLTPAQAVRFAAAFAGWVRGQSGVVGEPVVLVGRDSRPSGEALAGAVSSALACCGVRAVDLGVCTTPAVGVMVRKLGAWGGLVLTASHNPTPWNGIKPIRSDGASLPPAEAGALIEAFEQGAAAWVGAEEVASIDRDDRADEMHVDAVLEGIDVEAVRRAGLRVVVDSVHGAGGRSAGMLLNRLGVAADLRYVEPTGRFPHPPEPTQSHLAELCAAVEASGADLGFAQDPDADRLAIIGLGGEYLGEECTLVAAAIRLMEPGGVAVANLSTSRMIDDVAETVGGRVVRSAVGEANVASAMRDHGAAIGGEGNGGVVWSRVGQIRDSLAGMALVLELMASSGKALHELLEPYRRYRILKEKIPAEAGLRDRLTSAMKQAFPSASVNTSDGVRVDEGRAWVHVRPSNTEPIFRLIAEAETEGEARRILSVSRRALGVE